MVAWKPARGAAGHFVAPFVAKAWLLRRRRGGRRIGALPLWPGAMDTALAAHDHRAMVQAGARRLKPRILFVGEIHSSHARSWARMLEGAPFELRGYQCTRLYLPA